jgi:uncharacterized protein (UPF0332 family)
LEASNLLYDNALYNASANRAYHAAFHLAIALIMSIGINPTIDHKTIQSLFSDNFINRRKILPSKYKKYLSELQIIRNHADYMTGINKNQAIKQLLMLKDFFEIVEKEILK